MDANEARTRELLALKTIAETLNEATDLEPMLQGVLPKVLEALGFTTGWIFLTGRPPGLPAHRRSRAPARPLPGREAPHEPGRVLVPRCVLGGRAGAGGQHHGMQAPGRGPPAPVGRDPPDQPPCDGAPRLRQRPVRPAP